MKKIKSFENILWLSFYLYFILGFFKETNYIFYSGKPIEKTYKIIVYMFLFFYNFTDFLNFVNIHIKNSKKEYSFLKEKSERIKLWIFWTILTLFISIAYFKIEVVFYIMLIQITIKLLKAIYQKVMWILFRDNLTGTLRAKNSNQIVNIYNAFFECANIETKEHEIIFGDLRKDLNNAIKEKFNLNGITKEILEKFPRAKYFVIRYDIYNDKKLPNSIIISNPEGKFLQKYETDFSELKLKSKVGHEIVLRREKCKN
jgi:hypothetical protein